MRRFRSRYIDINNQENVVSGFWNWSGSNRTCRWGTASFGRIRWLALQYSLPQYWEAEIEELVEDTEAEYRVHSHAHDEYRARS